ncbi:MAG TPA: lipopolysaccharide transport periplasmic protein LptA [Gammaproteobacteria bacterium]|nr:lipopolysaccharide transport periplasmic protein LptA [Gammaproteobacteria bacterium]
MSPRNNFKLLALGLCGFLAAGGVWALSSDKNQPINVRADHGDFKSDPNNNSNGTGVYTGHVVITQGSIVLTSNRAVLHVVNNELETADVTGDPATFQQQPDNGEMMHGTAMEITYNASKNEIMLITDARLTQAVTGVPKGSTKIAPAAAIHANPLVSAQAAPQSGTLGAPAASTAPAANITGERLMTADLIRYNTDTQHVIAKGRNEEDRVHVSFPPKVHPTLAPQLFTKGTAPASITHFAPASARDLTAPGKASTNASPRAATLPSPAVTHSRNPS